MNKEMAVLKLVYCGMKIGLSNYELQHMADLDDSRDAEFRFDADGRLYFLGDPTIIVANEIQDIRCSVVSDPDIDERYISIIMKNGDFIDFYIYDIWGIGVYRTSQGCYDCEKAKKLVLMK